MRKYGKYYNTKQLATGHDIYKSGGANEPAKEGEIDKFNRGYKNRGAASPVSVLQLPKDICVPKCDGAGVAGILQKAFAKEFTEKNGTPLWRVMFDAVGADAFGTAFNNSSGEPDPAIIVSKLHLKYHLRMAAVVYFYSRDITDYIFDWPYPPGSFYYTNGWQTSGNNDHYNAWMRSQRMFGIREGHPNSGSPLQASIWYEKSNGGSMTYWHGGSSTWGKEYPWLGEDWGEPYLKEEWPPNWLIHTKSNTSIGQVHSTEDVGRGPMYAIYGSSQIYDYRFVTNMHQFLELLLWELTFFYYGTNGDRIIYPNGPDIYGQYPAGSHLFLSPGSTSSKVVSTYQESSSWAPGGATSSSGTTTMYEAGSLLIPLMDRDWCGPGPGQTDSA